MSSLNYSASALIASGAALSSALFLHRDNRVRLVPVHFVMPPAWTAANVTLQGITVGAADLLNQGDLSLAAQAGWPWADLWDPFGNEVSIPVVAGRAIVCAPQDYMGWWALRVRSGSAAAPVNQAADRAILFALREFD